MKYLVFFLSFSFACTKIEYIIEQPVKTATDTSSAKEASKKPPVDTVWMTKPYILKDGDGNVYDTVNIGSQTWLSENLKTTRYINGVRIPNCTDDGIWSILQTPAFCYYNNDSTSKNILYNWYAVNTGKLCPLKWHVATDSDWIGLELAFGMSQIYIDSMGWRDTEIAAHLESSDFRAQLKGFRDAIHGWFDENGMSGNWWTSTSYDIYEAYERGLFLTKQEIYRGLSYKGGGASVRCIKD